MRDLKHTSKVWPETNIISFQQFIHGVLDVRHVSRLVDAEREDMLTLWGRTDALMSSSGAPDTHLWAQHITATSSGSERLLKSPVFWGLHIPLVWCPGGISKRRHRGAHTPTARRWIRWDPLHITSTRVARVNMLHEAEARLLGWQMCR